MFSFSEMQARLAEEEGEGGEGAAAAAPSGDAPQNTPLSEGENIHTQEAGSRTRRGNCVSGSGLTNVEVDSVVCSPPSVTSPGLQQEYTGSSQSGDSAVDLGMSSQSENSNAEVSDLHQWDPNFDDQSDCTTTNKCLESVYPFTNPCEWAQRGLACHSVAEPPLEGATVCNKKGLTCHSVTERPLEGVTLHKKNGIACNSITERPLEGVGAHEQKCLACHSVFEPPLEGVTSHENNCTACNSVTERPLEGTTVHEKRGHSDTDPPLGVEGVTVLKKNGLACDSDTEPLLEGVTVHEKKNIDTNFTREGGTENVKKGHSDTDLPLEGVTVHEVVDKKEISDVVPSEGSDVSSPSEELLSAASASESKPATGGRFQWASGFFKKANENVKKDHSDTDLPLEGVTVHEVVDKKEISDVVHSEGSDVSSPSEELVSAASASESKPATGGRLQWASGFFKKANENVKKGHSDTDLPLEGVTGHEVVDKKEISDVVHSEGSDVSSPSEELVSAASASESKPATGGRFQWASGFFKKANENVKKDHSDTDLPLEGVTVHEVVDKKEISDVVHSEGSDVSSPSEELLSAASASESKPATGGRFQWASGFFKKANENVKKDHSDTDLPLEGVTVHEVVDKKEISDVVHSEGSDVSSPSEELVSAASASESKPATGGRLQWASGFFKKANENVKKGHSDTDLPLEGVTGHEVVDKKEISDVVHSEGSDVSSPSEELVSAASGSESKPATGWASGFFKKASGVKNNVANESL